MARKASMWAKAAGEYYRKNKGKNGITLFSDVLKSSDFKREYNAKYGKTSKAQGSKKMRSTRRMRGGGPPLETIPEGNEEEDEDEEVEGGRRRKSKSKGKKGTKKYFKMW